MTELIEFGEEIKPRPSDEKVLYRAYGVHFEGGTCSIGFQECRITRETAKGVWIEGWGEKKFVLNSARKRFAYPTKDEALQSFVARKVAQIRILNDQIARAERLLDEAERMGAK